MQVWGWRIPFCLAFLTALLGFYLRAGLPEPKAFLNAARAEKEYEAKQAMADGTMDTDGSMHHAASSKRCVRGRAGWWGAAGGGALESLIGGALPGCSPLCSMPASPDRSPRCPVMPSPACSLASSAKDETASVASMAISEEAFEETMEHEEGTLSRFHGHAHVKARAAPPAAALPLHHARRGLRSAGLLLAVPPSVQRPCSRCHAAHPSCCSPAAPHLPCAAQQRSGPGQPHPVHGLGVWRLLRHRHLAARPAARRRPQAHHLPGHRHVRSLWRGAGQECQAAVAGWRCDAALAARGPANPELAPLPCPAACPRSVAMLSNALGLFTCGTMFDRGVRAIWINLGVTVVGMSIGFGVFRGVWTSPAAKDVDSLATWFLMTLYQGVVGIAMASVVLPATRIYAPLERTTGFSFGYNCGYGAGQRPRAGTAGGLLHLVPALAAAAGACRRSPRPCPPFAPPPTCRRDRWPDALRCVRHH